MVDGQRRGIAGASAVTVGAAVTVIGTFLPWLRSGARNRSSYTIFDLVERLGFESSGFVAWSLRLWPLVPLVLALLAVAAWGAAVDDRFARPVSVLSVLAALWIGGTAVAVVAAPDAGLFRVGAGPVVSVAGMAIVLVGTLAVTRRGSAASEVS